LQPLRFQPSIDLSGLSGAGAAQEEDQKVADRYTKVMLTIIAISLTVLMIQNSIHPSTGRSSGDDVQKIMICDSFGLNCGKPQKVEICPTGYNCEKYVQPVQICSQGAALLGPPECADLVRIYKDALGQPLPMNNAKSFGVAVVPQEKN
jgi:hypothetical protein